jgi:hypothetical protein
MLTHLYIAYGFGFGFCFFVTTIKELSSYEDTFGPQNQPKYLLS